MLENSDTLIRYSPLVAMVLMYFLQLKIFVTPQELEKKHREIIFEAEKRFASRILVDELKNEIGEIKYKINKIYNYFLKSKESK